MTYAKVRVHPAQTIESYDNSTFSPPVLPLPRAPYRTVGKRALDLAVALLLLPVVLTVLALCAGLIALKGGQPVFAQARVGRGGKTYRVWKLRTMVPDAEAALEELRAADPAIDAEWRANQKLKDDPRITGLGQILRKYSIDELPQLWNVLKGDMSLVGPRPMMPCQRQDYPGKTYYALRPGITGPWQVKGRGLTTFAARAGFDDGYARDLSFRTDLRLLVLTVGVVLKGTGT